LSSVQDLCFKLLFIVTYIDACLQIERMFKTATFAAVFYAVFNRCMIATNTTTTQFLLPTLFNQVANV
jgi:hypothetical protein